MQKSRQVKDDDWANIHNQLDSWMQNCILIYFQAYDPDNKDSDKCPFVLQSYPFKMTRLGNEKKIVLSNLTNFLIHTPLPKFIWSEQDHHQKKYNQNSASKISKLGSSDYNWPHKVQNKFVVLKSMSGTWVAFKRTHLCQYTPEMSNTTTKRSTFKIALQKYPKEGNRTSI